MKQTRNEKKFTKKKKTNAIRLVLPNEEISLWPVLSSPPRFRIQGGYPELHRREGWRTEQEIFVSNIGLREKDCKKKNTVSSYKIF